jgi:LemA protein
MSIYTIVLLLVVAFVMWAITVYNRFVRLSTQGKEAWADIDVQLKRRYDLIPNLVASVKGYATHESTAFENVSKARAAALSAQSVGDKSQAEAGLAGALKSVFAIAEAYPELKANQNFMALQSELSDTENKIQASRRFYNGTVRDLNMNIDSFPGNVVANMFKFAKMEFFQLDANDSAARQPVKVSF